jgi:hypothetical protein
MLAAPPDVAPSKKDSLMMAFTVRRSLAAGLALAVSLLLIPGRLSTASPIFAIYSGADAGSLDGVGFSLSGLSNPSFGSPIQALGDMSGPD